MNGSEKSREELEKELQVHRERELMYLEDIELMKARVHALQTELEARRWASAKDEGEPDRPTREWRRTWTRTAGDETQRLVIRGRIDEYIEIEERKIAKAEAALLAAQAQCQKVSDVAQAKIRALRQERDALFFEEVATVYALISGKKLEVREASTEYMLARMPVEDAPAELVAIAIARGGRGVPSKTAESMVEPNGATVPQDPRQTPMFSSCPAAELPHARGGPEQSLTPEIAKQYVLEALERAPEGIDDENLTVRVSDLCGVDDSAWRVKDGILLGTAAEQLAASGQIAVKDHDGAWTYYALSHANADVIEPPPERTSGPLPRNDEERVLAALKRLGPVTKVVLQREIQMSAVDFNRTLGKLRQTGQVFLSGKGPAARYFLAAQKEPATEAVAPTG
jgi:hypothetical protein